MKFLKAVVVFFVISLPFIYGFNIYNSRSWQLEQNVQSIGQLPPQVTESSGLELADQPGTFYTHNDHGKSGADATLFKVDLKGKLLNTYAISGADNEDWEDLASDDKGNLYISDTGNNNGSRSNFKIYKVSTANPRKSEIISFSYEGKEEGKKKGKKGKNNNNYFDCEAIFWQSGNLYLVTKSNGQSGTTHLFQLPDSPGTHTAKEIGTKDLGAKITSADISPDGNRLALMSVGSLHVFNVSGSNFFSETPKTISLGNVGQTEALVFTDNNTLIFTNEGGQIFRYNF
jgi:hypothetical protein